MQIVYNKSKFKSEEECKEINEKIKDMDIDAAHDYLVENGYMEETRLKVKDLIAYLQKMDPEALLCYGEQNAAMAGEGYYQHMVDFMLPQIFCTVKKDKSDLKRFYVQEERMTPEEIAEYTKKYDEAIEKDYKYVKDEDIIMRIA